MISETLLCNIVLISAFMTSAVELLHEYFTYGAYEKLSNSSLHLFLVLRSKKEYLIDAGVRHFKRN